MGNGTFLFYTLPEIIKEYCLYEVQKITSARHSARLREFKTETAQVQQLPDKFQEQGF